MLALILAVVGVVNALVRCQEPTLTKPGFTFSCKIIKGAVEWHTGNDGSQVHICATDPEGNGWISIASGGKTMADTNAKILVGDQDGVSQWEFLGKVKKDIKSVSLDKEFFQEAFTEEANGLRRLCTKISNDKLVGGLEMALFATAKKTESPTVRPGDQPLPKKHWGFEHDVTSKYEGMTGDGSNTTIYAIIGGCVVGVLLLAFLVWHIKKNKSTHSQNRSGDVYTKSSSASGHTNHRRGCNKSYRK